MNTIRFIHRLRLLNTSCISSRFLLMACVIHLTICPLTIQANSPKKNYSIMGTVKDSVDLRPVGYATIAVLNQDNIPVAMCSSASDGVFKINLNNAGEYMLSITCIGFSSLRKPLHINDSALSYDLGYLFLTSATNEIESVTVSGVQPLVRSEDGKIIYNVDIDPEASVSQLVDILRKVPLLNVTGDNQVTLKGETSYKVLVNGKNSSIYSKRFSDVIQAVPASTIKEIEVITNPSSKYEAEGFGGIINIITKRKTPPGYLGSISFSYTPDPYNSFQPFGYIAVSKGIFNLSVMSGYVHSTMIPVDVDVSTKTFGSQAVRSHTVTNSDHGKASFIPINVNMSVDIDSLNMISIEFSNNMANAKYKSESHFTEYNAENAILREYDNFGRDGENDWKGYNAGIEYQKLFKTPREALTVAYQYSYDNGTDHYSNEYISIINYEDSRRWLENESGQSEHTAQVDYFTPLGKKSELNVGAKYIFRDKNSLYDVYDWNHPAQEWMILPDRSSGLNYYQQIYAFYGSYMYRLKQLFLRAGFRGEGTINQAKFSIEGLAQNSSTFNIVPYVSLTLDTKKNGQYLISYTQRLKRPDISLLNPFINDTNPENISYGNPGLKSVIYHTFDLNWNRNLARWGYNFTLNASFTDNDILQYTFLNDKGVYETTFGNIGNRAQYGMDGSVSYRKPEKYSFSTSFFVRYLNFDAKDMGLSDGFVWGVNVNGSIYLWRNALCFLNVGYKSEEFNLQNEYSDMWEYSLGVKQSLLKKKLDLSVQVRAPFNAYRTTTVSTRSNSFYTLRNTRIDWRQFTISLSYRFGKFGKSPKNAERGIKNDDQISKDNL